MRGTGAGTNRGAGARRRKKSDGDGDSDLLLQTKERTTESIEPPVILPATSTPARTPP
jgi:hypothetical protein